jgi:thiosulfate/3-mercaptopyruvate sulfurtransferase
MTDVPPLVSTDWLAQHLADPHLRVADASWYLPQGGRDAGREFEAARIPGALFFDIDALSDQTSRLPHMLPSPVVFASAMRRLGISDADSVVFYDGAGLYSAPRARWMMKAMGHARAAVLDGGFPKWRKEGRATEAPTLPPARRSHFVPKPQPHLVRDFAAIKANLATRAEQIVDARSPGRFRGEEAEPRPGVRPGHIPGAFHLYYADVLTAEGTMRSPEELREIFRARGIDLEGPVVTICGSGVTAAILSLAVEIASGREAALYDGSWSEWCGREDAEIETGGPR